jgi:hypothetical protein
MVLVHFAINAFGLLCFRYYNTPAFLSDDGLFRFFATTIDKIAAAASPSAPPLKIFLYNMYK